MLCESCQDKAATVNITQVVDGEMKKLHLCEECAAQIDLGLQGQVSLTDMLFGTGTSGTESVEEEDRTCPSCHIRRSEFKKGSQLGCPDCYTTFADELRAMFKDMHKDVQHIGKVPRRARRAVTLHGYRQRLDEAVASQKFEEAARLRDLIQNTSSAGDAERDET